MSFKLDSQRVTHTLMNEETGKPATPEEQAMLDQHIKTHVDPIIDAAQATLAQFVLKAIEHYNAVTESEITKFTVNFTEEGEAKFEVEGRKYIDKSEVTESNKSRTLN